MGDVLEIIRGDTPTVRLGPVKRDGTPVNHTGFQAAVFTVKAALADADPGLFQKTGTLATIDTTGDGIEWVLDAADTNSLDPGDYLWDAEIVEADGTKTTYPKRGPGTFRVVGDVTRT